LRPQSLEEEGLVAAFKKQIEATEARYEIKIRSSLPPEPDIPLEAKEVLYRICQEAVHNVVKHAHATEIEITLTESETEIELSVTDNGSGFDPDADYAGHLGLRSMRERAAARGGSVGFKSGPSGTTVRARLPVPGATPGSPGRSSSPAPPK
jgi:signal transduction histidine kinase